MKRILTDEEHSRLNKQINDAEKQTNSQIVLATVKRSDSYAEIPWIAFATGISVVGFFVFLFDLFLLQWVTNSDIFISLLITMAAGVLLAVLTIFSPFIARIFLSKNRRETETKQYAESMFLNRELFATTGRRGVLLLISLFERQIIILPDKGLHDILTNTKLEKIIHEMVPLLKEGKLANSLEKGLMLLKSEFPETTDSGMRNELSDEIIEEEGI
jgi:putative membrane protein